MLTERVVCSIRDDSRTRLASEVETNRQLTVKHELAAREAQRKIDQLVCILPSCFMYCSLYVSPQSNDLARKQQNLAVVQSTQRHLEQRIVDLGNAIAAKDDKLAIYEGRLPGAGPSQNPSLPKEQQIELELAHLR